jgi:hypothetical protein
MIDFVVREAHTGRIDHSANIVEELNSDFR